ncbi:MAG: thymidine phosphorylase [Bdellovibrionales bacterium GWB1_55_8]|nr:MAG: thymidine phosphorylase [Bdellovibrionales bacterium GWB1_55_8]
MKTNPVWTIEKKRDGQKLSREEIQAFIAGLASGQTADYQATAFLMAVFFRSMSLEETVYLTEAMLASGERYDLSHITGPKVDKHSTGGVGDKVSLILAPLAAACGLKVPMMSGRGLGHSGGTLDKLESISGFDVHLSRGRFEQMLKELGCSMIGQSEKIAPADKKLYSLRDVTGTVECVPLIAASILSKKLAEGTGALVLDVKVGSGAFMKTKEQARKLAKTLIQVGKKMDLPCRALLTDMSQPLGYAVGNALEVRESVQLLRNEKDPVFGSADLKEITIQLCAQMLEVGGVTRTLAQGRTLARRKLEDGSAWKIFREMTRIQGGSVEQIDDLSKLPAAPRIVQWGAKKNGHLARMDTETVGKILVDLGGGRKKASDSIDPAVGLLFHKKLGTKVRQGEPIVTVHAAENSDLAALESRFHDAIDISTARKPVPKLIIEQL